MMTEWVDKPMHERSFRVALAGYVYDDDPTVIADMQQLLDRYTEALEIIAGRQPCIDDLMSNVDVAIAALDFQMRPRPMTKPITNGSDLPRAKVPLVKSGELPTEREEVPEMVERVAKAICCRAGCAAKDDGSEFTICQAASYIGDARAAIEAMREPTEAMTEHASYQAGEWSRRNIEAYIDAALTTKKAPEEP